MKAPPIYPSVSLGFNHLQFLFTTNLLKYGVGENIFDRTVYVSALYK